jgi:tight adherence protein C
VPLIGVEVFKLVAFLATFATISVGVYVVLKTRTERASVRAGLEAALASPVIGESRSVVMQAPFLRRVVSPGTKRLSSLVYRFGPAGLAEQTQKRLVLAGLSDKLDADTFLAASAVLPLVVGITLVAYYQLADIPLLLWGLIPASASFPKMWLTARVEKRQHTIRLALADTLDLLTIAVEAGLGFDAALTRVVSSIKGPLSDELYRLLQEVRIGIARADALKALSTRTEVAELDQFITAVTQADVFGISIGQVLRVQAAQLRQKRTQMAEERAAKTPVKLLFPLLLCIFPALFVVLAGPAAITIMTNLFTKI